MFFSALTAMFLDMIRSWRGGRFLGRRPVNWHELRVRAGSCVSNQLSQLNGSRFTNTQGSPCFGTTLLISKTSAQLQVRKRADFGVYHSFSYTHSHSYRRRGLLTVRGMLARGTQGQEAMIAACASGAALLISGLAYVDVSAAQLQNGGATAIFIFFKV